MGEAVIGSRALLKLRLADGEQQIVRRLALFLHPVPIADLDVLWKHRDIRKGHVPRIVPEVQNDLVLELVQLFDELKQRDGLFLFRQRLDRLVCQYDHLRISVQFS
ncbi:hypothetical protein ACTQ3Z_05690 [Lawsonibacter sp. LCP25S3_F5]